MFTKVEIVHFSNGIALSVDGEEYQIVKGSTCNSLLLDQVMRQLKLSRIQYAYSLSLIHI